MTAIVLDGDLEAAKSFTMKDLPYEWTDAKLEAFLLQGGHRFSSDSALQEMIGDIRIIKPRDADALVHLKRQYIEFRYLLLGKQVATTTTLSPTKTQRSSRTPILKRRNPEPTASTEVVWST